MVSSLERSDTHSQHSAEGKAMGGSPVTVLYFTPFCLAHESMAE